MVKFAAQGDNGYLVGLGFSHENLRLLADPMNPIVFAASEVGLGEGKIAVTRSGAGLLVRAVLGAEVRSCIELTAEMFEQLRSGKQVFLELGALGFARAGVIALLAGPTEQDIVASLRVNGIVAPDAHVRSRGFGIKKSWLWQAAGFAVAFVGIALMLPHGTSLRNVATVLVLGGVGIALWGMHRVRD